VLPSAEVIGAVLRARTRIAPVFSRHSLIFPNRQPSSRIEAAADGLGVGWHEPRTLRVRGKKQRKEAKAPSAARETTMQETRLRENARLQESARTAETSDGTALLQDLVAGVQQAISTLREAEAQYVLRMADVARAARRGGAADESSIDRCASALGISRQTLQPYAIIALRWTARDLRDLFGRRDSHGRPISLSHLLVLARLPQADRSHWIEVVLAEGMPVHELRERLRNAKRSRAGGVC
jgi:hypothetical protein